MTISYPLALPTITGIRTAGWAPEVSVAVASSAFSFAQQVQANQGERWAVTVTLPPMLRAKAETWLAWKLALRGQLGTFLMGDPDGASARGTIAASGILVNGSNAIRTRTLALKSLAVGATIKAGDYLQLGSTSTARLHKVLADATADGSGLATVDIWPALRATYADGAAVATANCVGLFRLTSNVMAWESDEMGQYGISFAAVEAL